MLNPKIDFLDFKVSSKKVEIYILNSALDGKLKLFSILFSNLLTV